MRHFRKYILFAIPLLVLSACFDEENDEEGKKILKIEYLKELSNNWSLSNSGVKGNFLQLSKFENRGLKTGEQLYLEFKQPKYLGYIEFIDSIKQNTFYKLYLNERYAGKYRVNQKIGISKKVRSLRVLVAKTGNERIVEGWDKNYDYICINDTLKHLGSSQKLIISLPQNKKAILKPFPNRTQTKELNGTDFEHNILILKDKKKEYIIEQSVDFKQDGTFSINYLKVARKNKKILYEYFLKGSWKFIKKYKNKVKVELSGTFSGQFSKKESYKIFSYEKQIIIDSLNIIRSNDFLNGVMLELPNWVMVNLGQFNNDFIIDIPYSTTKNITGIRLYECNKCYLLYQTVKDLLKVQEIFRKKGLKVKLLDCYRPHDVQKILYDAFPVSGYVADPIGGSIHNRGTAVDLTLVDSNGKELDMGTQYDDLSVKSNHGYIGFEDTVLQNRKLLRETMNSCNFVTIRLEWWHYNHQYARKYPKLNDDFPCDKKN